MVQCREYHLIYINGKWIQKFLFWHVNWNLSIHNSPNNCRGLIIIMLLSLLYLLIFLSGNSAMIVQECVSHNVLGPVVNTHFMNIIFVAPSRSGFSSVACADWCTLVHHGVSLGVMDWRILWSCEQLCLWRSTSTNRRDFHNLET